MKKQTAQATANERLATIKSLLKDIEKAATETANAPDLHWGHVGDLGRMVEYLNKTLGNED